MLQCNVPEFCLYAIMLNISSTCKALCSTNSTFYFSYATHSNHKLISICSLLVPLTAQHIIKKLSTYVHKQLLINAYFGKIIITDSPKSHNPVKNMYLYQFSQLCGQYLPMMLALLYSMFLLSYYAQNYVGIIGSSLFVILKSS